MFSRFSMQTSAFKLLSPHHNGSKIATFVNFSSAFSLNRLLHSTSGRAEKQLPTCDFTPKPYKRHSVEILKRIRQDHLSPSVKAYYCSPLLVSQASMQYIFDQSGRRYLDLFGGIVTVSVGHCHPKVNEALREQIEEIWHTTPIYLHSAMHEYAEMLLSKLPPHLKVIHYVNSGTEANDLALLLTRLVGASRGNHDVISLQNAYHGVGTSVVPLTGHSTWKYRVPSASAGNIHQAMNADPYRGVWGGAGCRDSPVQTTRSCSCGQGNCQAADLYARQLEETIRYSCSGGRVAGMFVESIQGVGGTVQFPIGYVKQAEKLVHDSGGLLIMDEVQTGFGRTGEHYWGFEAHDVKPDIVTMAKGIGNGFPLGAVATTKEVSERMSEALHFNTYGGNPLASAVGMAVLKVLEEDGCQQRSADLGTKLLQELALLRDKYPVIGDVRGKGLMIGVELVQDRETRDPLPATHVIDIWENMKDQGVLVGKGGFFGNVLRIKPPMCITMEDVQFAVEVMDEVFSKYHQANSN